MAARVKKILVFLISFSDFSLLMYRNTIETGRSGTCLIPIPQEAEAEDLKFKANLGYVARTCLKKKKKRTEDRRGNAMDFSFLYLFWNPDCSGSCVWVCVP
jgi:hypothetical protein